MLVSAKSAKREGREKMQQEAKMQEEVYELANWILDLFEKPGPFNTKDFNNRVAVFWATIK